MSVIVSPLLLLQTGLGPAILSHLFFPYPFQGVSDYAGTEPSPLQISPQPTAKGHVIGAGKLTRSAQSGAMRICLIVHLSDYPVDNFVSDAFSFQLESGQSSALRAECLPVVFPELGESRVIEQLLFG